MPSLAQTSTLLLFSSLQLALVAAEPIQLDFKRSLVNVANFEKRDGGSEVAALNQDQYRSMYTLVSSLELPRPDLILPPSVDVSIGTPGQKLSLQVDTGSFLSNGSSPENRS